MASLNFDKDATIADILKKIGETEDEKIDLLIDTSSPIVKNALNFRLLEKLAAEKGKEIKLSEVSPTGEVEEISEKVIEENLGFVEEDEKEEAKIEEASEPPLEDIPLKEEEQEETLSLNPEIASPPTPKTPQFGLETPSPSISESGEKTKDEIQTGFIPGSAKLPKLNFDLKKLTANLRHLKFSKRNLLIAAGVGVFLIVFFGLFYVLPSADVKLYVASQNFDKQATVTATPRLDSVDVPSSSIPLTSVQIKESGSASTKVNGKKNVGDPAKGKVTIRNYSTSTEKTLVIGTILSVVGKSSIQFNLDRAVTVPSGTSSASFDSVGRLVNVIDPGRIDVNVTASKIGTDGNVSSGTRMSVANQGLDIVDAVANGDFNGGSSKEVTVVSLSDRTNLLATLSAQLSDKAREEIKTKLKEGQKLPDGGIDIQVTSKVYSKDIDQEATDLNLNLEVTATGNVYNEKDLAKLMVESAKQSLPEGYKVSDTDTQATAEVLKVNEDKTVTLLSSIKTKLVPDLNIDEIKKNLKGKNLAQAKEYLKELKNIDNVDIKLNPQILSFLDSFPRNEKNIKVEIVSNNQ